MLCTENCGGTPGLPEKSIRRQPDKSSRAVIESSGGGVRVCLGGYRRPGLFGRPGFDHFDFRLPPHLFRHDQSPTRANA